MICEECNIVLSALYCIECDQALCPDCSVLIHNRGRRQQHVVLEKCTHCKYQKLFECTTCQMGVCHNCQFKHLGHYITNLYKQISSGVLVDLDFCGISDYLTIKKYLSEIENSHNIGFLRSYSKFNPVQLQDYEIRERESLAVDISMEAEGVGIIILISENYQQFVQYLNKVQDKYPGLAIFVASKLWPFRPVLLSYLEQSLQMETHIAPQSKRANTEEFIITYLNQQSAKGKITCRREKLIAAVQEQNELLRDKVAKALEKVIKNKLVTKTVKKFGANKKAVLISQQIHSIKKENLLNLLKSLKRDEMYPSERNILYRIKEVYHLKPKNWKQFITKLKSNPNSPFDFIEIVDPITKQGSHAIYIKGDFWQTFESRKHQNLQETDLWQEFVDFMMDYFRPIDGLKLDNDTRPIAGGRYGCAQFVKLFGTKAL